MTQKAQKKPISVLYWCEPHPLRNGYTEHFSIARMLIPALCEAMKSDGVLLRVFSNTEVIDRILENVPDATATLQRPTNDETRAIDALFSLWDEKAIQTWLRLVRGEGPATDTYVAMLERLHSELPIDVILTWSENGAVRRFCEAHGIPVLFGELGPTRTPFVPTMYFDPQGTNANASHRKKIRKLIENASPNSFLPASTWLLTNESANPKQETTASLVDMGLNYRTDQRPTLPEKPYLFVPLQLADDLNTLLHSDFNSPLSFLRHVVEMAHKAGYGLVVKGHPGVKARPYNVRREVEALDWLEQNHPDAVILPRACARDLSVFVMANAAYTVSINSSVGFEGMILGVPPLVLGQAAFDADGWLQENIPLLPAGQPRDFATQIDALVSAHMEHILVPNEVALQGEYLATRLRGLVEKSDPPIDHFSFSQWHILGQHKQESHEYEEKSQDVAGKPWRTPALGRWQIERGATLRFEQEAAVFTDAKQTLQQTVPLGAFFKGFIERVETDEAGDTVIIGWVLEKDKMRPPLMVLLIENGTVVSRHRVFLKREDVQAAFSELDRPPSCGFHLSCAQSESRDRKIMFLSHSGAGQILPKIASETPIDQNTSKSWLSKLKAKVMR